MKKISILVFAILFAITAFSQSVPTTDQVLQKAYAQAKKEHKKVFLLFHASWCGWCHHMDTLMSSPELKSYFQKNYVITHITVLENGAKKKEENEGGMTFLEDHGGKDSGIPYWLILDASGKYIANSRLKSASEDLTSTSGDNTGCPGTPEEIAYFKLVLERTGKFTPAQLDEIGKKFAQKS
ncbi:thioredoxin family protein [Rhizosphaericola mali]|uniref:Thioredoxin family protein n=1 Tax=Rhizosphaericola mali TaxID=2545455 RepID=A0A5P2FY80_9BACT|nr:thioredoxin family protein [Rhizosphaericola mali]QES87338.1 thioredoxin family protein [Rhizosphaericola mali]